MANFHIEGRLKNLPDILTNFMWEIDIVDITSPLNIKSNVNDLSFRVKNISTPSRSIEPIETWFYGLKKNIPGRTSFSNQISLTIEETEDQFVLQTIYDWMERIQGIDPTNILVLLGRKLITKTMLIKQIKYNGQYAKKIIELKNVYPLTINESNLDMSGNESIKYDVQFNYDYWVLR